MSRWVRRAAERRVRIASRRRARRSPRAAGGLGTCSFRRSGRLRGCSAFRHPHQGTSVALLPGTRLAHSSDPSGLSSYGLTKSLGEGDILVASFFFRISILWWWWQRNSELPQAGFPESGEVYLTVLSQPLALATIRLLLPAEPLRLLLRRSRETREREREI